MRNSGQNIQVFYFANSWDSAQDMRGKAMFGSQLESEADEAETQTQGKTKTGQCSGICTPWSIFGRDLSMFRSLSQCRGTPTWSVTRTLGK